MGSIRRSIADIRVHRKDLTGDRISGYTDNMSSARFDTHFAELYASGYRAGKADLCELGADGVRDTEAALAKKGRSDPTWLEGYTHAIRGKPVAGWVADILEGPRPLARPAMFAKAVGR